MTAIEKEVQSLINTLGFLEKGVYHQEPDCFQNVRDLIRHLRCDDRSHIVRRLCNGHNIVKNDLVPIMRSGSSSDELFDASLRLAVNLCQPTLLLFDNRLPDEASEWKLFCELEGSLGAILVAFTGPEIFKRFAEKMKMYFDKEWDDREEKDRVLVERIFVLIRSVFSIGVESVAENNSLCADVDSSIREKVIAGFFASELGEIFTKVSGISIEAEFCSYIVAILALILRNLNPKEIACEGDANLLHKRKEEFESEQAKVIQTLKAEEENLRKSSRRSFLSGSVVVKGMKALNPEREFVMTSSLLSQENVPPIALLSRRKRPVPPNKNRRICDSSSAVDCTQGLQDISPATMLAIKQFCSRMLLEGKYNRLMKTTKDAFNHHRHSLKATEFHYFTLVAFMLAFARHSCISCQHIASTFYIEFLHQVACFLMNCFERIKTDREHIRKYALSAQYAVSVFREIITTLDASKPTFPEEKVAHERFCQQLFQVEEYRELAAGILGHLSPAGATRKMLQDLIITNHYFLHLIGKNIKQGAIIRIQKKRRQKRLRKEQKKKNAKQNKIIRRAIKMKGLPKMWDGIVEQLSDTLRGEKSPNMDASPVNMLIKAGEEQLQQFALLQVQVALRTEQTQDAVGIYRNARVLWPETGTFGREFDSVEEELLALEKIFHEDMQRTAEAYSEALKEAYGSDKLEQPRKRKRLENGKENEEGEEEEEEEENEMVDLDFGVEEDGGKKKQEESSEDEEEESVGGKKKAIVEEDLDFTQFVLSMAKPAVINWYIFSLRQFRTNSTDVNLAILKFFHRIAFDLKSPSHLYLATLFSILREVDREVKGTTTSQTRSQHPHFKLWEFGYYLLRRFFGQCNERRRRGDVGGLAVLVCELLFTKSAKEVFEIEHGYEEQPSSSKCNNDAQ